jgi:UDP-N-acetylmuramoyl-tripeptide--D-alanyl-D-alanine ligase
MGKKLKKAQLSISDLADIISADISQQGGSIGAVSIDSRSVGRGDCFFAIPGPNFDGHNFVGQAIRKGAVCAVVNHGIELPGADEKYLLRVDDTVKALGALAARYRTECGFKVIAITGSVGKTTTRHIIAHVLSSRYHVSQAPKNFNNQIGLPLTLLAARPDTQFVVTELGTNKPGEIAYLSKIACPDVAVINNVCPAHLEGFGTIEAIIEEKLSIADGLSHGGMLFINGDNQNLVKTAQHRSLNFKTFGLSQQCDIHPEQSDWNCESNRSTFGRTTIKVPLGGRGNLENSLAAWAVCNELGFTTEQFADAVRNLPAIPMRTDIKRLGAITVIDDCYNANPGSMKNALELLSKMAARQDRRPVFICGDMAELGAQSQQLHRELASDIVSSGVQCVIAVGPLAAVAASTAKDLADYVLVFYKFTDADFAADNLHKFIKDYDIVLVKGSRTATLEKCVEKLRLLFENRAMSISTGHHRVEHRV